MRTGPRTASGGSRAGMRPWLRFDPAVEQPNATTAASPIPCRSSPTGRGAGLQRGPGGDRDTKRPNDRDGCAAARAPPSFTLDPKAESGCAPSAVPRWVRETTRAEQLKPKACCRQGHDRPGGREFRAGSSACGSRRQAQAIRAHRPQPAHGHCTRLLDVDSATRPRTAGERGDDYTVYVTRTVTRDGRTVNEQVPQDRDALDLVSGAVARNFDDVLVLASTSLPSGSPRGSSRGPAQPQALRRRLPLRLPRRALQVTCRADFTRAAAKMDVR